MFKTSETDGRRAPTLEGRQPPHRLVADSGPSILRRVARFFLGTGHVVASQLLNDPLVEGMAERVRAVIARQPGHRIDVVAQTLRLSPGRLERLVVNADDPVDTGFLIDVIAALVHESGIDPKWLLTGQYDPATHRKALLLGEDRSSQGAGVMRAFVEEEYRRVLDIAMLRSDG